MNTIKSGRRRKNVLTNELGQTIDGKSKQLLFYECAVEMVKQVALKPQDSFSQNGANEVYEKYAKKRPSNALVYCLIDRLRFQRKGTFARTFRKYLPYRQIKHFFVFPSSPSVFMLCVTDEGTGKRYYETYRCRPEDVNAICDLTYKASIDPQNILRDVDALRQISILSRDDERLFTQSHEPSYNDDDEYFTLGNNKKFESYFDPIEKQYYENSLQPALSNDFDEPVFNRTPEPEQPNYRPPHVHNHALDGNLSANSQPSPTPPPKPSRYQTSSPSLRPGAPKAYPRSIIVKMQGGSNPERHTHQSASSLKPVDLARKLPSHNHNSLDSLRFMSHESHPDERGPLKVMYQTYNNKGRHKHWSPALTALDEVLRSESLDNQPMSCSVPQQYSLIPSALSNETSFNLPKQLKSVGDNGHQKAASKYNLNWGDRVTYIQDDPHDGTRLTDDGPFYMYITRHESHLDVRPYAVRNESRGTVAQSQPNLHI